MSEGGFTFKLLLVGKPTKKLLLKVSKFQNEFMKSSFLPNYETKVIMISAL